MPNYVKNTTFLGPLDLLFPHSCRGCGRIGDVFCDRCKNYIIKNRKNFCPKCKNENPTGICASCGDLPPIYVVSDRNGPLGSFIHDYKYHSIRALASPLADLLDAALPDDLPANSVLVPLPTATHHIRQRGFDHTLLLAKKLSRLRRLPVEQLLLRSKNTVQVGADRAERLTQVEKAYEINPKIKIDPEKTYILLDDVWTTGASVLTAEKILKNAGAKNTIICLLAYSS